MKFKTVKLTCTEADFTATEFYSAAAKLKFVRQFVKFVSGGFRMEDFPKWFYERLSNCFSHIAHFNQDGFYSTFFDGQPNHLIAFVRMGLLNGGNGDPKFTFCDAELILRKWLTDSQVLEQIHLEASKARVAQERENLRRLVEKYGGDNTQEVLTLLDYEDADKKLYTWVGGVEMERV